MGSSTATRQPETPPWQGVHLYTIGHSTRPADEFLALLRSFGIRTVADIRTIPRSRRHPQFEGPALAAALEREALRYAHLPELGGLRHARKDSPNTAWRNAGFRGYADYMQTGEFEQGLRRLRDLSADGPLAIMCAEAVPWRCHRSLVADALVVRGAEVDHITGPSRSHPHKVTPFARVRGLEVSYPGE